MKITVSYTNPKHFTLSTINQWVLTVKKYKFINGFIIRIFGLYINVRENKATEKLIKLSQC